MVARGCDTTVADNFKYFALISSIPVALFTLKFCNCLFINEAETCGISNSVPSGTLLATNSCSFEHLAVCFVPLMLRSL